MRCVPSISICLRIPCIRSPESHAQLQEGLCNQSSMLSQHWFRSLHYSDFRRYRSQLRPQWRCWEYGWTGYSRRLSWSKRLVKCIWSSHNGCVLKPKLQCRAFCTWSSNCQWSLSHLPCTIYRDARRRGFRTERGRIGLDTWKQSRGQR